MRIYNNNPAFGHCGPFEAKSFEALADEMTSTFKEWAYEDYGIEADVGEWLAERIESMRREFIEGLAEVLHCDECGQDYHADAPERGHADGCSMR